MSEVNPFPSPTPTKSFKILDKIYGEGKLAPRKQEILSLRPKQETCNVPFILPIKRGILVVVMF